MSIKGLQYFGKGNGISIVLYKSYKSVILSWNKPYKFTSLDITSQEAKEYYINNYHQLGVRIVEEFEKNKEKETKKNTRDKNEVEVELSNDFHIINKLKGILSEVDKNNIDLSCILDQSLDLRQIKDLCRELNFNYGNKRSKSKIIKELTISKKLELLNLLN